MDCFVASLLVMTVSVWPYDKNRISFSSRATFAP
jgi:hypothetical protein